MKYFWYYKRTAYRDANYKNGFFAATLGFNLASKNHDYCTGYYVAVGKMQAQAEEIAEQAGAHNEWAEGYGWISDKLHRGEPFESVISDLDNSEKYTEGVRAAVKAALAIERTRQATLELNRVEVEELKKQLVVKEKQRAAWCATALHRGRILDSIQEKIGEEL